MDLSDRQITLIKFIVEEYTSTGEPVGSHTIETKYRLGVSPATIRNEMADLVKKGYLSKPHSSAGRVPTASAIKFYVSELMRERDLSVAEEVAIKQRVWEVRDNFDDLLREATKVLAERTRALSIAATNSGHVYHSGYPYLLNSSEFYDIDLFREILILIDEHHRVITLFSKAISSDSIHLLLGSEMGHDRLDQVSCLFADIQIGPHRGSIGILAPNRQHYEQNIPFVRYIASLVNQIAQV